MLALLDADILAHRASAAAVREDTDWEGNRGEKYDDIPGAIRAAIETAHAWTALAGCTSFIACFSGPDNFRKVLLPTYKQNRKQPKPGAFKHVVEAMRQQCETRVVVGLEADDVMGILHTREKYADSVIVTLDKDLRTVPGRHFNPLKDTEVAVVTQAEADTLWMLQVLTGDVTDGYSGCPGIGPVKALKLLEGRSTVASMWAAVTAAYEARKQPAALALTMARVARILRHPDYDTTTKAITLWPPDDGRVDDPRQSELLACDKPLGDPEMNNLTRAEPEPDTDMPRFEADAVHQPAHYANNIIEPVTFINANGINFNRGNAIKYLVRAGKKEPAKELEDLRKAARYIEIEMECIRRRADVADGMDAKDVWKVAL